MLAAMRSALLGVGCLFLAGCTYFDIEPPDPPDQIPPVAANGSCTALWKQYADELHLLNDDETNWLVHDDKAIQYAARIRESCGLADQRDAAAVELRCKALWGVYVRKSDRMVKDDRAWRDHDVQQTEAMNRIRSSCAHTACTALPGIRCLVPTEPS